MTDLEFIYNHTPRTEQLTMLAEECCELAQAALKLRRVLDPDTTPTPVSKTEAEEKLDEEIADVLVCIDVLGNILWNITPVAPIKGIMEEKTTRWAERIREQEASEE